MDKHKMLRTMWAEGRLDARLTAEAVEVACKCADSSSPAVRETVAWAISQAVPHNAMAAETVARLSRDGNRRVRLAAVQTLARQPLDKMDVQLLCEAARDEYSKVREVAVRALSFLIESRANHALGREIISTLEMIAWGERFSRVAWVARRALANFSGDSRKKNA